MLFRGPWPAIGDPPTNGIPQSGYTRTTAVFVLKRAAVRALRRLTKQLAEARAASAAATSAMLSSAEGVAQSQARHDDQVCHGKSTAL